MVHSNANILIVEDTQPLALTYRAYLQEFNLPTVIAENGNDAIEAIRTNNPTVILLDLGLPDMDGLDILKFINANDYDARVIVITANGSVSTAVAAMREGAADFLLKPFSAERIITTVKNAIEMHRLANLVEQFEEQKVKRFDRFIGKSPAMQAVYSMIADCAPSKASVFIMGPSGTGKELCAEAVHHMGPRKSKKFVALNCAAIPENLIESEISGHKKGAFTGAIADRAGAAVSADGGTLFLDEICEMPIDLQAKLLRFIQTGQVVPVGSNIPVSVNVRFVCATNRIAAEEVSAGRLREDLYYRLHVIPIHLPPLKDRGQDVIEIAEHLLKLYSKEESKSFTEISADAKARLLEHSWPGNVRELGNVIQSTIVLNNGPILTGPMLARLMGPMRMLTRQETDTYMNAPSPSFSVHEDALDEHRNLIEPLETSERRLIERAIALSNGKVRKAAKKLEVDPSTLYRKIKDWAGT